MATFYLIPILIIYTNYYYLIKIQTKTTKIIYRIVYNVEESTWKMLQSLGHENDTEYFACCIVVHSKLLDNTVFIRI